MYLCLYLKIDTHSLAVVAHAFNPSTLEAEIGKSLSAQGQPGLQVLVPGQTPNYKEILSQKPKKKKERKEKNDAHH